MSLITIAYTRDDFNQLPFQNVNPNRRMMVDDVAQTIVCWDDINGVPLFTIGGGGGAFYRLRVVVWLMAQSFQVVTARQLK
jgi:hypothetical protein